jgi:parallel beta-helix repeat protein
LRSGRVDLLKHNTADNNAFAGFDLALTGGTVSQNTALDNQESGGVADGVEIAGSGNSITNNTARNNTGDGFLLSSLSQSTFSCRTTTTGTGFI